MSPSIKRLAIITLLAASATSVTSTTAYAHGPLESAKFGGIVVAAKDVEYEFVIKPDSVAVYVEDHGKKISTEGATAKLILLNAGEKSEVALTPAGANKLEAKGTFKAIPGTKAVSVITLAGKPSATARFELK
jgi:hypothetical protein